MGAALLVTTESAITEYRAKNGRSLVIQDGDSRRDTGEHVHDVRELIFTGDSEATVVLGARRAGVTQSPAAARELALNEKCLDTAGDFLVGNVGFGDLGATSVFELAARGTLTLRPDMDARSGVSCFVIDSNLPTGHLTIWIAPDHGYNVAKFEYEQTAPTANFASAHISFDDAKFAIFGGRELVSSGHFISTFVDAPDNGVSTPPETHDVRCSRTSVEFDSEFDDGHLFSLSRIPNGTQITLRDAVPSGLRYIWKDGQVVPLVDKHTLDSVAAEMAKLKGPAAGAPVATTPATASSHQEKLLGSGDQAVANSLWSFRIAISIGTTLLIGAVITLFVGRTARRRANSAGH